MNWIRKIPAWTLGSILISLVVFAGAFLVFSHFDFPGPAALLLSTAISGLIGVYFLLLNPRLTTRTVGLVLIGAGTLQSLTGIGVQRTDPDGQSAIAFQLELGGDSSPWLGLAFVALGVYLIRITPQWMEDFDKAGAGQLDKTKENELLETVPNTNNVVPDGQGPAVPRPENAADSVAQSSAKINETPEETFKSQRLKDALPRVLAELSALMQQSNGRIPETSVRELLEHEKSGVGARLSDDMFSLLTRDSLLLSRAGNKFELSDKAKKVLIKHKRRGRF